MLNRSLANSKLCFLCRGAPQAHRTAAKPHLLDNLEAVEADQILEALAEGLAGGAEVEEAVAATPATAAAILLLLAGLLVEVVALEVNHLLTEAECLELALKLCIMKKKPSVFLK